MVIVVSRLLIYLAEEVPSRIVLSLRCEILARKVGKEDNVASDAVKINGTLI